jgi:hypothetical protein
MLCCSTPAARTSNVRSYTISCFWDARCNLEDVFMQNRYVLLPGFTLADPCKHGARSNAAFSRHDTVDLATLHAAALPPTLQLLVALSGSLAYLTILTAMPLERLPTAWGKREDATERPDLSFGTAGQAKGRLVTPALQYVDSSLCSAHAQCSPLLSIYVSTVRKRSKSNQAQHM